MARLLPFLLVASLVVIAASAFSEEQEDSLAEIKLNEALAEPAADAARRGKGSRRQRKIRQRNGNKGRNGKKARNGKKSRNGKKVRKGKKVSKKNKKGKAPRKQNKGKKNNQGKKNKGKKTRKTMKSGCMSRAKSAQCGVDAVEALKFEGSVVDNFITQKKRALNFKGIVEKKQGKKANFANATSNMLDALGGNSTAPVCKMAALRLTRASAAEATANYATLAACTTSIETDCGIANGTIDEAGLETCNETIFAIKTKNAECIAKATADEKCACFAEAAVLVAAVKAGNCKQMGIDANKAMKASKKTCVSASGFATRPRQQPVG